MTCVGEKKRKGASDMFHELRSSFQDSVATITVSPYYDLLKKSAIADNSLAFLEEMKQAIEASSDSVFVDMLNKMNVDTLQEMVSAETTSSKNILFVISHIGKTFIVKEHIDGINNARKWLNSVEGLLIKATQVAFYGRYQNTTNMLMAMRRDAVASIAQHSDRQTAPSLLSRLFR